MSNASNLTTDVAASQDWKDFIVELIPPQGQWSEEQYLILTDHRGRLIEFSDGFLEVLPMPTDQHQTLLKFLFLAFFRFFEARGGSVQFAPLRLRVRPGKFREPDLLVLVAATDERRQDRYWLGADLVVEVVSEDKPERDLVDKRCDYAEAGVPEYWIVNPQTQTVAVLRLQDNGYVEAGVYRRGESAASILAPEFTIEVNQIFDAVKLGGPV